MIDALHAAGLRVLGGMHECDGFQTLLLIGPDGVSFWEVFTRSPEYCDGQPDPLDRWSTRVLTGIASDAGATALFPFGGPAYQPFIRWAQQSGRCFPSPVQLLVHPELGLFTSFRGALGFERQVAIPSPARSPCESCDAKPCLTACPVEALNKSKYDVAACHVYLDTDDGAPCMTRGCAVRRACPVGQSDRPEAQSAFHMTYFHRKA